MDLVMCSLDQEFFWDIDLGPVSAFHHFLCEKLLTSNENYSLHSSGRGDSHPEL
jgi:hypothetical protein